VDGCFKTKLKDRGIKDPDLGTGLAYMVNDMDYAAHLEETAKSTSDKVVSTRLSRLASVSLLTTLGRLRVAAQISTLWIKRIHGTPRAISSPALSPSLVGTRLSAQPALLTYKKVKSELSFSL
jgi:hypothetical protein